MGDIQKEINGILRNPPPGSEEWTHGFLLGVLEVAKLIEESE